MRRGMSILAAVVLALGLVACGGDGDASPADVDLVGTWTGDYRFPLGDRSIDSGETLVIERRDGDLLFGYDEYVQDGETIRIPVVGSVDADGEGFVLAEEHGFFLGEIVDDDTLRVRFVRTDDQFTSFEMELGRAP